MSVIRRLTSWLPLLASMLATGLLMVPPAARAQSDTKSYLTGKTLTIIVNQSAGQPRDLEARLYAEFLGNYLPGKPNIKIVNMGGAAGLRAVRYLYGAVHPDGLTIGYLSSTLPTQQLLEKHHAADEAVLNLDLRKFGWIAASGGSAKAFYVTKKVPYKTAKDLLFGDDRKFTVVTGATRPGSTTFTGPAILVEVFHAPIKIVTGYSAAERDLAMMRGELSGNFGRWGAIVAKSRDWFKDGFMRPLLSEGVSIPKADLDALGIKQPVPDVFDLVKDPKDEAFLRVALYPSRWGSLIVAPPKTPKDRVAILREAFDKLRKDPKFMATVEKRNIELNPITGAMAEQWVGDYLNSPADVVKRYLDMVKKN
jgi:tripartite-type tricarboxylate transporter receptor subunit TctC